MGGLFSSTTCIFRERSTVLLRDVDEMPDSQVPAAACKRHLGLAKLVAKKQTSRGDVTMLQTREAGSGVLTELIQLSRDIPAEDHLGVHQAIDETGRPKTTDCRLNLD